jgi:hypothetical protein
MSEHHKASFVRPDVSTEQAMADEMASTTTRPPRRRYLNDEGVARLRPRAKRYTHADPELIGHYVRVLPTGVKKLLRRSPGVGGAPLSSSRHENAAGRPARTFSIGAAAMLKARAV